MNSKLPTKLLIVFMTILIVIPCTYSTATEDSLYSNYLNRFYENNLNLQLVKLELAKAYRSYDVSIKQVDLATESWNNLTSRLTAMGKEISNPMKCSTVLQRKVAKEKANITIEQNVELAKTKENTLYLQFRDYYYNSWQAYSLYNYDKMLLDLELNKHDANAKKYELGHISLNKLNESKSSLLSMQAKVKDSFSKYNTSLTKLAQYISSDIDSNNFLVWESKEDFKYSSVNQYIDEALNKRLDLRILTDQIVVNNLTIDTYDKFYSKEEMSEKILEIYNNLKDENYYKQLEISKLKADIEIEIRVLYNKLKLQSMKVQSLITNRNNLNSLYLHKQKEYENGLCIENDVKTAHLKFLKSHQDYIQEIYSYNSNMFRLNFISTLGLNINNNNSFSDINSNNGGGR